MLSDVQFGFNITIVCGRKNAIFWEFILKARAHDVYLYQCYSFSTVLVPSVTCVSFCTDFKSGSN